MTSRDIVACRLVTHHIASPVPGTPADGVKWLVAVQAQDYSAAKWSLGVRLQGAVDGDIERAFTSGAILRTHLLRPTWHFVTPADIRWLLALTAPNVHAANAYMRRKLELDQGVLKRSNAALSRALQGGKQLTRDELRGVLQKAAIPTKNGQRLSYIMMHAELEGIVCSGPRRGKQFTYSLLEERVPSVQPLARDEALAELAGRYFVSRGPATVHDFAKWSGLSVTDARSGLEAVKARLQQELVGGNAYWFSESKPSTTFRSPTAFLLSVYDEYISGYKERSAIVDANHGAKLIAMGNALNYVVVVSGQIVGTWKRALGEKAVVIETNLFRPLTQPEQRALTSAADHYGRFVGLAVKFRHSVP